MSKKSIALDATILTALMECPRKTNYRFNMSLVPRTGKANSLECGSLVHVILEWYNKSLIAGSSRPEAISKGYEAFYEYKDGYKPTNKYVTDKTEQGILQTPEQSEGPFIGWKFVLQTMEEYFDYWKNDTSIPVASEEVRGRFVYEDDDMRIVYKAKFDEIVDTNVGMVSRDHKMMKQNRETISLNNQFKGQALILGSRTVVVNKIGFQKSLPPEKKFIRQGVSYTADNLAEFANETIPHYARMLIAYDEANVWPPNQHSCEGKYGPCIFKEVCETDRGIRNETLNMLFIKGKEWDISND